MNLLVAGLALLTLAPQAARSGAISGRVLDPSGRPAAVATVSAARLSFSDGRPTLVVVKTTTSDDRGEYRLYGLDEGQYVVRGEKNLPSGPARAFFPGTRDASSATKIAVSDGADADKTDFVLQNSAVVNIFGVVNNVVPGFQSPSTILDSARGNLRVALEAEAVRISEATQFYLVPKEPGGIYDGPVAVLNALTGIEDRAAGRFELRGVPQGTYELYAIFQDRGVTPRRYYVAHNTIVADFQDVRDVALTIAPGADVKGRVLYHGKTSRPATPVQVQLRPKEPLPNTGVLAGLAATVADDGTFTLPNVPDLSYSVSVMPLPAEAYIADIQLGNRPIFDRGITAVPGDLRDTLEVMVDGPGGTVRGTASAVAEQSGGRILVTLVPEEIRRENLDLYKRTLATTSGDFLFANVTPGRYKLFAWEKIPDGAEKNSEFMSAYWDMGTEIVASAGSTSTAALRLILK